MSNHTPPKDFPTHHFCGVSVPYPLAQVIREAATKDNVLFEDKLLEWAQAGAEHSRLCRSAGESRRRKPRETGSQR